MSEITEEQLEKMISDLKEQLRYTNDDTICDELIAEIKFRETELKQLTIQNKTL